MQMMTLLHAIFVDRAPYVNCATLICQMTYLARGTQLNTDTAVHGAFTGQEQGTGHFSIAGPHVVGHQGTNILLWVNPSSTGQLF